MRKKEYLKALDTIRYIFNEGSLSHYDDIGKSNSYTQKELDQAHRLLAAMINSAKKQLKKGKK
jgi:hypothetical protein